MADKYGEAIGILHIDVGGANIDIKPKKGDNRRFRRLLMNPDDRKDRALLMEKFEEFVVDMIHRDNPSDSRERIEEYVEFNSQSLFEFIMVAFRWTTKEQLVEDKKKTDLELKKLIGES